MEKSAGPRFDAQLWHRFLALAQPYFFPAEEGGRAWGLLLLALVLAVVSGTYWLALLAAALAKLLLPASLLPASIVTQLTEAAAWPKPFVALAGALLAVLLVGRRRRHLHGRWRRWGMLAMLLFLLLCVTGLNVYISFVFRGVDNHLVQREEKEFYEAMLGYGLALVVAVPVIAFYRYMRMALARQWRQWLTEFFLEKYLARRNYYRLDSNEGDTDIDNPDQRISEDVDYFTAETLSFLLDVLGGILDLISFTAILWSTSQRLMGSLLAYASVGTILALALGQRLVELNYERLRREADLRYSLIHIRDNAEAIAFYGGEGLEAATVRSRLDLTMANYDDLVRWTCLLTIYQRAFFYCARLVPYLVIGGLYFAKQVDFGTVGQGAFAFHMVLTAVTLLVERIRDVSRFSAGVNRLGAFYECLTGPADAAARPAQVIGKDEEELVGLVEPAPGEIRSVVAQGSNLEVSGLTLQTPTGRTLVEGLELALASPEDPNKPRRLLVVGPSGLGKSSLLRALAGLWTRGKGHVRRPPAGEMLFLPQKPYMPLGDLRTQLLYPNVLAAVSDDLLLQTLSHLGLGDLPTRFPGGLDAVRDWPRVLSGGEQQRLAAARCLVAIPAPVMVVLDEATSALPLQDEGNLYQLLRDRGIDYVSVGHRSSLLAYHDVVLELCGQGAWRLMAPRDYELGGPAAGRPVTASGGDGLGAAADAAAAAEKGLRRRVASPDRLGGFLETAS